MSANSLRLYSDENDGDFVPERNSFNRLSINKNVLSSEIEKNLSKLVLLKSYIFNFDSNVPGNELNLKLSKALIFNFVLKIIGHGFR